jgi:two-component system, OmpR family, manganese sensing sensor histidine kinase
VFQTIRHRLLLSYLTVLMMSLGLFAIAVRTTFANSLDKELVDRIEVLAESAKGELDLEGEKLQVDGADLSLNPNQSVQWFDLKGNLIEQRGDSPMTLPFDSQQTAQIQRVPYAKGVILPVTEEEKNDQFIGYVRVSESFEAVEATLNRLDWILAGSVALALVLSGLGGIGLTYLAMEPIEESFQRLQQFTADASHELRNPLMAIKSNATVALKYAEGMRDLDVQKFRAIASATTQMTALSEDLLTLARSDQAAPQQRENVNLSALLKDLLQLYQAEADMNGIRLNGQIFEPLSVLGDATQLNRLFTNLISNALRYTPKHGYIELQAHPEKSQILVSVRDTGIGLAPDQLARSFDRFWRADRSRGQGSGFGLGLAIAQNIAQNHGGSITVSSELNIGSCFTVKLPANTERVSQSVV